MRIEKKSIRPSLKALPEREAAFIEPMDCAPVTKLADGPIRQPTLFQMEKLDEAAELASALTPRHSLDRIQEHVPVVGFHLCKKPSELLKVAGVFTPMSPCL